MKQNRDKARKDGRRKDASVTVLRILWGNHITSQLARLEASKAGREDMLERVRES